MKISQLDPNEKSGTVLNEHIRALEDWVNTLYEQVENEPVSSPSPIPKQSVNTSEDLDPRMYQKRANYEETRRKWHYRDDDPSWLVDRFGINHLTHKIDEFQLREIKEDIEGFVIELPHETDNSPTS